MHPIIKKLLPIALLLILILATAGCDTLVSDDTEGLQASGVVEAVEVEISPQMGGRVVEVLVSEGSQVAAGDVLASLDTIDLAHAIDQARAALATAEAELAQAQAGARPEDIAAAQGAVMVAQGNVAAAEGALTQAETGTGFAADAAEAELAQAQGRLASARAELARASAELARLQAGPRPEEVAMYQALLNQAQSDFLYYENLHFDQFIDKDIGGGPEERSRYQRESARGARDAAQARLDLANAGATEQEIASARAGVSAAQGQVAIAEAGVTAAEVALAKAEADTPDITIAEAQVQIAEGQLVQAQAQQDRLEAGATAEELDILETRVAQAQANLETVNAQMEKLVLKTAFPVW